MRVLLVQRYVGEASINAAIFRGDRFVADLVRGAAEAYEFLGLYDYDIVVLDSSVEGLDGCAFIRRMRARNITTPVLMLSNPAVADATVEALRAGADDVMTVPFRDDELVARIEAIVRRSHGHGQSTLQIGAMVIDMATHDVIINGQPLHLTKKEFSVLQLLALRRGKVLTRQAILDCLYDGVDGPEIGIVGVFICNLRKKLAAFSADNLIDTVRGYGYMIRDRATPRGAAQARHKAVQPTHEAVLA
ncbi:response regulator transcription factor [Limobrevibacterium gyesilva]|uniref:Response regulator transcription factor n=1 Tax=Limobrevibacterium gyesilva TaxID=2991712 RepID=A0AA42CF06_9PROT|nr:response regulator transcription factor [Limobrevibacterium gyesilva]MCW3476688.1 response regulator transcription factor [Limobrevibacterium gyesilva]